MSNSDQLKTVGEVMATEKWVDKPVNGESYERFFIKDKETHEWIFGISRESFAKSSAQAIRSISSISCFRKQPTCPRCPKREKSPTCW